MTVSQDGGVMGGSTYSIDFECGILYFCSLYFPDEQFRDL